MNKPNFVFFLVDDMGWADLSCYGSSFHETPNLDRLAQHGVRFTDAYASCPVCSPTRASILTGKYPATLQLTNFIAGEGSGKLLSAPYLHYLRLEEATLADTLRENGYSTWHVGKWHLGGEKWHALEMDDDGQRDDHRRKWETYWPENRGFDVNVGGWSAGHPRSYFSPYNNPRLEDGPEGEYLTDRLTDEAVALIRDRDPDKPFYLNMWYYTVHTPIQPKPELEEKYRAKAAAMGLDQKDPFEVGEEFPCLHKAGKHVTRRRFQSDPGYAAMVQSLDESVGRLLDTLDEQGIAEETVVIFTSDNGGLSTAEGSPTCNAPLREGKGWMEEGGIREPLIVHWPGVTVPDTLCDEPVTSTDFYPTLLEMASLPAMPAQHSDGVSFAPLLRGEAFSRPAMFWHYPHYSNQGCTPACAVREGDWKLIEFFEDRRVELYNLREDIGEEHDLSAHRHHTVEDLRDKLHAWLESSGAQIPQPNPDYPGV
ncbi:MAG: sulfatase [Phycisphaerae bacterium]